MSNKDDDFDDFSDFDETLYDGLSELELSEKEFYLLEMAFNNSYDIITNKITFEELVEIGHKSTNGFTTIAHDVDTGPSNDDINKMITYFENKEEYEKCAVLYKMIY